MSTQSASRGLYTSFVFVLAGLSAPGCGARTHQGTPAPDSVQVGYGTQARRDVATAISSVPGDSSHAAMQMEQLFEGKVAGVEVLHLNGGKVSLRIRGQNSLISSSEPLYIIDGTPVRAESFTDAVSGINPQAVKRIEILKDAAATSIYGSAGANGVVIIMTKRGDD